MRAKGSLPGQARTRARVPPSRSSESSPFPESSESSSLSESSESSSLSESSESSSLSESPVHVSPRPLLQKLSLLSILCPSLLCLCQNRSERPQACLLLGGRRLIYCGACASRPPPSGSLSVPSPSACNSQCRGLIAAAAAAVAGAGGLWALVGAAEQQGAEQDRARNARPRPHARRCRHHTGAWRWRGLAKGWRKRKHEC